MTQIVYHKGKLYADTKSYRETGEVVRVSKLKSKQRGNTHYAWAFAGTYLECLMADAIIASDYDPEMMAEVDRRLANSSHDIFGGIVVESTKTVGGDWVVSHVFLANYFGDLFEVEHTEDLFLAVGSKQESVTGSFHALSWATSVLSTSPCDAELLVQLCFEFGTKGTTHEVKHSDIQAMQLEGGACGTTKNL